MAMHLSSAVPQRANPDDYLFGPLHAWFAFVMTVALMLVDYIDRQVIVSLFPHLKQEWDLSDKQLGALVSAVSVIPPSLPSASAAHGALLGSSRPRVVGLDEMWEGRNCTKQ